MFNLLFLYVHVHKQFHCMHNNNTLQSLVSYNNQLILLTFNNIQVFVMTNTSVVAYILTLKPKCYLEPIRLSCRDN